MTTMEIDSVSSYSTLIQLISAVNFAYIFTRFHQRVYKLIFDEKKLLYDKFTSFINDMAVDEESLQSMDPIETTKGTTNVQSLNTLKDNYKALKIEWDKKKNGIAEELQKVKNVKGVRSLFLYISLFCLTDLFNIATVQWLSTGFWIHYAIWFSLLSVIAPIILTCYILRFTWKNKSEVSCYTWTSISFAFTVIISLILAGVNSLWYNWVDFNEPFFSVTFFFISLIMPFYACVFSIFFVLGNELLIKRSANRQTKELRDRQKQLHEQKIDIDKSYNMFSNDSTDTSLTFG